MPVAGVSRNPLGQRSNRFHRNRLILMTRRQDVVPARTAQPGTIRRLIRGLAAYTGAAPAFSWTRNEHALDPVSHDAVSTPLRYTITTRDTLTAGNQLSQPIRRPHVRPNVKHPPIPLTWAGNRQGMPTVRNRVRSLGSRITPLNGPLADAAQDKGGS